MIYAFLLRQSTWLSLYTISASMNVNFLHWTSLGRLQLMVSHIYNLLERHSLEHIPLLKPQQTTYYAVCCVLLCNFCYFVEHSAVYRIHCNSSHNYISSTTCIALLLLLLLKDRQYHQCPYDIIYNIHIIVICSILFPLCVCMCNILWMMQVRDVVTRDH